MSTNPDGFPKDQTYILEVTSRELLMLRHFNMKELVKNRDHLQDLQIMYKNNFFDSTLGVYAGYLAETMALEDKMCNLTRKINGHKHNDNDSNDMCPDCREKHKLR